MSECLFRSTIDYMKELTYLKFRHGIYMPAIHSSLHFTAVPPTPALNTLQTAHTRINYGTLIRLQTNKITY